MAVEDGGEGRPHYRHIREKHRDFAYTYVKLQL